MADKFFGSLFDAPTSDVSLPQDVSLPEVKAARPDIKPEIKDAQKASGRAGNWMPPEDMRPIFEAAAKEFNVPVNVLMALSHQESRYNPNAVGQPTQLGRAKGLMQYLDSTAAGLGINPFDPAQAIPAAAKQLSERLRKGYSMEDAVKEHFAGPDRKKWGEKTSAYGREVMEKVGKIGELIEGGNADLQKRLDAEEPGRYRVMSEDQAMSMFSPNTMSREAYEGTFIKLNPNASQAAIDNAMGDYDKARAAKVESATSRVQNRFDTMQSPEAMFDQRLNRRLQGPANGIVPKLPGKESPEKLGYDPDAANRESKYSAVSSYIGKSLKSGMYDLLGAGSKILDEINPWTLSPSDAAVLFKDDPEKLKKFQDESSAMILSRFARSMTKNAEESMSELSDRAKRDYGSLEYMTTDQEKAAYRSPTKVIGDAVRSLPSTAAMAVSVYLTKGAAARAEQSALAAGMSQEAAKHAAVMAGAKAMATAGTVSEGAVGYAQQANQSAYDASKIPLSKLSKSPKFQRLIAEGFTPEAARAKIIADTGEEAGQIAGIVDAAVNKVGGEFLGKIITEGGSLIPRIMKGAANESATEFVQSAGEKAGENIAIKDNINPNQSISKDVGESAVAGGFVGGLMGGVVSGVAGSSRTNTMDNEATSTPADPVTTVVAVPAEKSTAAGTLSRAVENAADQEADQPPRAEVRTPNGTITGFVESMQDDGNGGFTARILADDGQVYTFTEKDGVQIAVEQKQPAGPLTSAVEKVAEQAPPQAETGIPVQEQNQAVADVSLTNEGETKAAEQPAAEAPKSGLSTEQQSAVDMINAIDAGGIPLNPAKLRRVAEGLGLDVKKSDAPEVTVQRIRSAVERMNSQPAYAKEDVSEIDLSGRTDQQLETIAESGNTPEKRAAAAAEIERRKQAAPAPRLEDMDEPQLRARMKYIAGQAKANGGWNKLLTTARKEVEREINRRKEATSDQGTDTAAVRVRDERAQGAEVPAQAQGDQQGAGAASPATGGEQRSVSGKPESGDGTAVPGADVAADAQPALTNEYAGKWFGSKEKADAFIAKKKAGATHEVVQTGKVRFEVKPKETVKESLTVQAAAADQNPIKKTEAAPTAKEEATSETARRGDFNLKSGERARVMENARRGIFSVSVGNSKGENMESMGSFQMDDQFSVSRVSARANWAMDNVRDAAIQFALDQRKQAEAVPAVAVETPVVERDEPKAETTTEPTGNQAGSKTPVKTGDALADYWANSASASIENDVKAGRSKVVDLTGEKPTDPTPPNGGKPAVSENKVFTEDAAAKARALLKSRLSGTQLNSGIDPEIMQAGITLAGYHIEKGARTFAAYAQAMVDDLGDVVKPYLKSWYLGVRFDPRAAGFDGMSTAAEVEGADIDAMLENPAASPTMEVKEPKSNAEDGYYDYGGDTRDVGIAVGRIHSATQNYYNSATGRLSPVNLENLLKSFDEARAVGVKVEAKQKAKAEYSQTWKISTPAGNEYVAYLSPEGRGNWVQLPKEKQNDTEPTQEDAGTGAEGQAAGPVRADEGGRDAGGNAEPAGGERGAGARGDARGAGERPAVPAKRVNSYRANRTEEMENVLRKYVMNGGEGKYAPLTTPVDRGSNITAAEAWIINKHAENVPTLVERGEWPSVNAGGNPDALTRTQRQWIEKNFHSGLPGWMASLSDADKAKMAAEYDDTNDRRYADLMESIGKIGKQEQVQESGSAEQKEAKKPTKPRKAVAKKYGEAASTEDAGEELKFNKRNRKAALTWDDLKGQDAALRVSSTTKAKVLEKPDYQALIDGGMHPYAAYVVKQVYDSISAKPQTRLAPTDEQLQQYISGVNRVMAGVVAWANGEGGKAWVERMGSSTSGQQGEKLLDAVYPEGWRSQQDELRLIGGNNVLSALQPGLDDARKAGKEIDKGWPAKMEAWQKQGYKIAKVDQPQLIATNYYEGKRRDGTPYVSVRMTYSKNREQFVLHGSVIEAESKNDEAVKKVVDAVTEDAKVGKHFLIDKSGNAIGSYDTLEAAQEAARDKAKRDTGGNVIDERGISVEMARRTGKDRRMEGEDVTSERLMEDFGFRGVNFGNWLKGKSNSAERQLHLNHAYDSFMDLADVLGVPPKAMSLNGMLGIAIGAQGNGKAAAHFVPGMNEINITRTAGAGALAHEWGHALDHYFARLAGLDRESEPYLTEHATMPAEITRSVPDPENPRKLQVQKSPRFASELRQEILEKFKVIVTAMNKREMTPGEIEARRSDSIAKAKKQLDGWLASIKRDFRSPSKVQAGKAVPEADFDAVAERIRKLDLGDGTVALGKTAYVSPVVDELRGLYKKATGSTYSIDNIKSMQQWIDYLKHVSEEKSDAKTHVPQTTTTTFAVEAAKLDKDKGGKKYWSTDIEKFARAFDAYVSDKLAEKAMKNTYLAGLNNAPMTSPMGEERNAINKAFDGLVETIETSEEGGNVSLYSKNEYGDPSNEEAKFVADSLKGKSLVEVAEWLAKNAQDADQRLIANRAAKSIQRYADNKFNLSFEIAAVGDNVTYALRNSARGETSYAIGNDGRRVISVVLNGPDVTGRVGTSYETALHEIVHAATAVALDVGARPDMRGTEAGRLSRDMRDLLQEVKNQINMRKMVDPEGLTEFEKRMVRRENNALQNEHELVAWAMTNREAQQWLEGIEYQGGTAWSKFVSFIRRFLGLDPKKNTALSEALRLGEEAMDTFVFPAQWSERDQVNEPFGQRTMSMEAPNAEDAAATVETEEGPKFSVAGEEGGKIVLSDNKLEGEENADDNRGGDGRRGQAGSDTGDAVQQADARRREAFESLREFAGIAIATRIENQGASALVGASAGSPKDLAAAAQIYRNPRFETSRVVFVRGGRVVFEAGVTSRLPGYVAAVPATMGEREFYRWIGDQKDRLNADGYYLMHNHPSGDPTPSGDDVAATVKMAGEVAGFLGHVIINSNKYAVIDANGNGEVRTEYFGEDNLLKASKPHELLNRQLASMEDLAVLGKSLQQDGYVTLIGIASKKIRAITSFPLEQYKTAKDAKIATRYVARKSGSSQVFVVGDVAGIQHHQELIEKGFIASAIDADGKLIYGRVRQGMQFGINANDVAKMSTRGEAANADAAAATVETEEGPKFSVAAGAADRIAAAPRYSVAAEIGDTIEVDGVQRSTTNSNGKLIAQTEEGLRNFWRWFGESKVVDAEGRPLVVYHGTTARDITEFRPAGVDGEWQKALDHFKKAQENNERYGYMNFRTVAEFGTDKPMTKADLQKSITSGVIGSAVARMIDAGVIQLHDTARTLPKEVDKNVRGIQAVTMPDGTIHMVANTLTRENARGVLLHEMFHRGGEKLIGSTEWSLLMGRLGSLYRQSEQSTGRAREFFDKARARVAAAKKQGAVPVRMEVEEFAAYAIEEYQRAPESLPAAIRKWVEDLIGMVKAWMVKAYGKQIGQVTPAQLEAFAKLAMMDVAIARRGEIWGPIGELFSAQAITKTPAFPTNPDIRYSVKPEQADAILAEASDALQAKDDFIGGVVGDLGMTSKALLHPRQIAAIFPQFTPVYRTGVSQIETRDAHVAELGAGMGAYDALPQESKEKVNKVLELGRLMSKVFSEKDLADGVANTGSRTVVALDEKGKPKATTVPVEAVLTGKGEVVQLTAEEIKAYSDLRVMFDRALDMMRDQTLEDMGYGQFAGQQNAAKAIMDTITKDMDPAKAERIANVAKYVAEIEQAKRAGYVPFARYGDYVVTVKEKVADVSFIEDDTEHLIAQGLPESFVGDLLDLGAEKVNEGWRIKKSQKKDVERLTEKTVYSAKIETGLRDMLAERNAGTVEDINAVKDAIEAARKEWVGDNPARRVVAFKTKDQIADGPVNLTDVAALAELSSIDNATWDMVHEKLIDAQKARGFRRHLIHSDNVPGYTGDFERAMADYVISMAGYLSRRQHMKRWENSVSSITEQPRLHKYATAYRDYLNNPQEELAMVRQIGFFSYIAGVPMSAFANLTQVPIMTVPTLAQVAPMPLVLKELASAYKDALSMISTKNGLDMFSPDKAPADVREALKQAWDEGSFVPLETYDLMMTARQRNVGRRKGVKAFNTATQVISLSFTFAERVNRLVTFIAAARLADKRAVQENAKRVLGKDALARAEVLRSWSPKAFAEWAVDESQYRMGKANRPTVMRGVGSAIMQFKGFMLQTFEAWYRMVALHGKDGKFAAAASIATLYAFAGLWGLPGADDLRKLLENIYKQITDKDLDLKTELRGYIARVSGSNAIAQIVNKGVTYPLGLDMTRVGMGTIVPDSPLAAAGIPFDMLIGRPKRAFEKATVGDYWSAAGELSPNFLKNPLVAAGWSQDGVRDKKGNRILLPSELSKANVAMKALGAQPAIVTDIRDYEYAQRRQETAVDALKRTVVNKIAKTIGEMEATKDPEKLKELDERLTGIYQDIADHNETASPEQFIKIDQRALRTKIIREMEGVKSTWGKERKAARGAAEELRGTFGLQEEDE